MYIIERFTNLKKFDPSQYVKISNFNSNSKVKQILNIINILSYEYKQYVKRNILNTMFELNHIIEKNNIPLRIKNHTQQGIVIIANDESTNDFQLLLNATKNLIKQYKFLYTDKSYIYKGIDDPTYSIEVLFDDNDENSTDNTNGSNKRILNFAVYSSDIIASLLTSATHQVAKSKFINYHLESSSADTFNLTYDIRNNNNPNKTLEFDYSETHSIEIRNINYRNKYLDPINIRFQYDVNSSSMKMFCRIESADIPFIKFIESNFNINNSILNNINKIIDKYLNNC